MPGDKGRYQIDYISVKQRFTDRCNIGKVEDKATRELFQKAVRENFINTGHNGVGNINEIKINTKHSILKAAKKVIGKETRAARKPWIDEGTL